MTTRFISNRSRKCDKLVTMSLLTALFGSHTFAIDFSDRSLRLLALGGRTLNKLVLSSSRIEVPEGLIVHAEIKDQEAVSELIRTLVHDAGPKKISSKTSN